MKHLLSKNFFKLNALKITLLVLINTILFSSSIAIPPDLSIIPNGNNIIYVDKNASGDGSGSSWANAIPDLAIALKWASQNYDTNWGTIPLKIYVAKGVYKPSFSPEDGKDFNDDVQNNTFLLINNVHIYGGFNPSNNVEDLDDIRLLGSAGNSEGSVLSGDIGVENDLDDNTYHVVISSGTANNAILDGFTIANGRGTSPATINVLGNQIYACSGGGIYSSESSPILKNLLITNNSVFESGGGYFGYKSSPTMSNITFQGNSAGHGGGLANQDNSSPTVVNAKFVGNSGTGSAIYNVDSSFPNFVNITVVGSSVAIINDNMASSTINNSIIWGGIGGNGSFAASYSLIEGESIDTNGNIDATGVMLTDIFTDAGNSDYTLKVTSLAVDNGSNSLYVGAINSDLDLAANSRLYGSSIDIGAYEKQDPSLPLNLLSFDGKTSLQGNLLQWKTANEVNFVGFEIERAISNQPFSKIGFVSGKGAGDYQFLDNYAIEGDNYYRLKQIDKDGSFTYSKVVVIDFSLNTKDLLVYPIPAKDKLNLVNAKGDLSIINNNGQVLKTINISNDANTSVNISDLASGLYILQFKKSDGQFVVKKIVVDKSRN